MALNKIYPKSESVCVLLAAQGSAWSPEYRFVFAYNRFEIISLEFSLQEQKHVSFSSHLTAQSQISFTGFET